MLRTALIIGVGGALPLCGFAQEQSYRDQWVQADHILVEKEAAAKLALEWIAKGGTSFEAIAQRWSSDPGSAVRGGQLSVAKCSEYVTAFAAAVCTSPLATIRLVQTQFGWHVYRVKSRAAQESDVAAPLQVASPETTYPLVLSCHFRSAPEKSVSLSIDVEQVRALIGQQPALLRTTETHYTLLSNGLSSWAVDRTTGLGQVSLDGEASPLAISCRKSTGRLF